jgi:hypothetical protein
MSSSLQRRVKNLEATTEFKEESNRLKIVMGYMQHLPPEYQGPRYLVIRDRLPWSVGGCLYEWEEVVGPAPKDYEAAWANIMLVELVRTEPYRLGDARRKHEAEAQQNGGLR